MDCGLNMIVTLCLVAVSVASYLPPRPPSPCDEFPSCVWPYGSCIIEEGNMARCECFCGYQGAECNVPNPGGCVCQGVDCGNGYCRELGGGQYTCQCNPGFYGPACQDKYPDPCYGYCNVGECKVEYGVPTCKCPYGFTGAQCEQDVNECTESNIDCNYGTCVNEIGFYYCKCDDGYEGDLCDNKKFSCAYNESPCDPLMAPHKYYYTHKNSAYFVQCDDFGKCFDMPCDEGSFWDKKTNTCKPWNPFDN